MRTSVVLCYFCVSCFISSVKQWYGEQFWVHVWIRMTFYLNINDPWHLVSLKEPLHLMNIPVAQICYIIWINLELSMVKHIADSNIYLCYKFVEVIINMRLMFEFLNMTYQTLAFWKLVELWMKLVSICFSYCIIIFTHWLNSNSIQIKLTLDVTSI